jgi:hypothetical protein
VDFYDYRDVNIMTIKEFYDALPSTNKNILSTINSDLLGNAWTNSGVVSSAELTSMNLNIWASMLSKEISKLVENYFELANVDINNMTAVQYKTFVAVIFTIYKDKWLKLFNNIFLQEYNPIWNVDGTETETREFTHGKITTETKALTTETDGENNVVNNITQNQRNGFNSSTPVDTEKSTNNGSSNGNTTTAETGTDTFVNSGKDIESFTKTRGGNIGVTSTQNMLEQELELRRKFNYFEIVKTDIINELSLNIY